MNDTKEYTILDGVTPVSVSSSTDATPIVVTANSHGFSDGDQVLIYGHTTNTNANGTYEIKNADTNTFELIDLNTKADIAGNGSGAGSSGLVVAAPKMPLVKDFRNAILSIFTGGTATLTVKAAGSVGDTSGDSPNFGATVSASNPYDFLEMVDLEDGSGVDGDTGVPASGADVARQFEVNINRMKYFTVFPTSWTQGSITVQLLLTDNQ